MRTPYPNELRITNREAYPNELMHYGILGMKWGVRRYQNPDGTLTEAGKKRYGIDKAYDKHFKKDVTKERINEDALYAATAINAEKVARKQRGYKEDESIVSMKNIPITKSKGNTVLGEGKAGDARDKQMGAALEFMTRSCASGEYHDYLENKWDKARDSDMFDINFLESIQNSKLLYDGDNQGIMIEYAYYLADPGQYMRERANMLEEV